MIHAPTIRPDVRRALIARQAVFFVGFLTVSAFVHALSVVADRAHAGAPLPLSTAMVWEVSSHLMILLLIPAVAWTFATFPLQGAARWRSSAAHVLATVPFSFVHTVGMVGLRRLAYMAAGEHYDFGPFWANWLYEYRKDCLTYALVLAVLASFRLHAMRAQVQAELASTGTAPAPAPAADQPLLRLVVTKRNREFILDTGTIDRIDADGNYVVIHAAGENYRIRDSLEGMARRLGPLRFARVHRTHLVNIGRVREIQPWDHGDYRILLQDGSFVNFSRRYRSRLKHLFP